MLNIIVTGGAGFIGSNLSKHLLNAGHRVVAIDNLSHGYLENIQSEILNPNFTFVQKDLSDPSVFNNLRADIIVHLASEKIPRYSNAFSTLNNNYIMLQNAIKASLSLKAKLVFASTSDVYGKNTEAEFSEESDLVMGPVSVKRWTYALSKIYGEHCVIANHEELGLEYTIMRFFGAYGPFQNVTWWGGPQAVFIQNILENKQLEIHGDGLQTRTFTYIDDLVKGIDKCMFHSNSSNEIFNIAASNESEISILNLANKVWQLMEKAGECPIKYIPYETFGKYEDVRNRRANTDKIKSLLGYDSKVNLEEGLKKSIAWQTRRYKAE